MKFTTREMPRLFALAALMWSAMATASAPLAELISARTEDGVLLHGLLYSSPQSSRTIVIHIPGGPGAFYSAQDMSPLATSLNASGYHFLSINTRTAGGLGMSGMMYARFEDYREDIAAAVRFVKTRGFTDVILLGHSLGSARVAYYLSGAHDSAVKAVIFSGAITSPYLEAQLRWNETERAAYDKFLVAQRERVKLGKGRELVSYPWAPGRNLELSAASWISIFGTPDDSNASTVKFAKEIVVPVLIVHGSADTTALPANPKQILAALVNAPAKELIWVDGDDHLFSKHTDQFAQIVTAWVKRTLRTEPVSASR